MSDGRLAGSIGGMALFAEHGGGGAHEDQRRFGWTAPGQVAEECATAEKHAGQVHIHDLLPAREGHLVDGGRLLGPDAGVGHQHIDLSPARESRLERRLDLVFLSHVRGHNQRVAGQAVGQCRCTLLSRVPVKDETRAFGGHEFRHGGPDPAGCPGDEDDLVFQARVHGSSGRPAASSVSMSGWRRCSPVSCW
jgi:hypothetical protein